MKNRNILLCLLAALIIPTLATAESEDQGKKGKGPGKIDSNGDKVITLAEAEAAGAKKIVEHFAEIDADGNRELSHDELKAHRKTRMEEGRNKAKEADTDNNGSISKAEAKAAGMQRLLEKFDEIDANGDGELSREEMRDARPGKGDKGKGPGDKEGKGEKKKGGKSKDKE